MENEKTINRWEKNEKSEGRDPLSTILDWLVSSHDRDTHFVVHEIEGFMLGVRCRKRFEYALHVAFEASRCIAHRGGEKSANPIKGE